MATSTPKALFRLLLLAAIGAGLTYLVVQARQKKQAADATVDRLQHEMDDLDPATRMMVRARLVADSVRGAQRS